MGHWLSGEAVTRVVLAPDGGVWRGMPGREPHIPIRALAARAHPNVRQPGCFHCAAPRPGGVCRCPRYCGQLTCNAAGVVIP